jgi:hypothetical protein
MDNSRQTNTTGSGSDTDLNEGTRRSVSDQPTNIDSLGFKPYVRALAEFLINPQTEPPLTLSIEGEWGSGKSSFMMQLADELDRLGRGGFLEQCLSFAIGRRTRIVWFNAWRHDKVDSFYSGFAIRFLEEIRKKTPIFRRLWAYIYLCVKRFDRSSGGLFAVLRVIALWLFFISSACFIGTRGIPALYDLWDGVEKKLLDAVPGNHANRVPEVRADPFNDLRKSVPNNWLSEQLIAGARAVGLFKLANGLNTNARTIASWTGYFLILLLLLERIVKLSDPIRLEAKKRMLVPDYEKNLAFIEQFHRDFGHVVDAYFGNPFDFFRRTSRHRVFVFVDDLDRCEVPRAADLIQGLNLLISDSPKIVFILGIDRQKIAAALAVKYKDFLPYFPVSHRTGSNGESLAEKIGDFDPRPGLEFGYSFLEKFIQLSFFVPKMESGGLNEFLRALEPKQLEKWEDLLSKRTEQLIKWAESLLTWARPGFKWAESRFKWAKPFFEKHTNERKDPNQGIPTDLANDSSQVLKIASVVSESLGFNPRRLKQFLNVFRLQRFIAYYTKQLSPEDPEGATPEQLGKFVAILLRWPGLLLDLLMFPNFLKDIGNFEDPLPPAAGSNETKTNQIDPEKKRLKVWRDRAGFLDLLFASPVPKPDRAPQKWADIREEWRAKWSLESFKTANFLNVRGGVIPTFGKKRHGSTRSEAADSGSTAQSETDSKPTGEEKFTSAA